MVWSAHRIYLNATSGALAHVRSDPVLHRHSFLLTGALPASWDSKHGEIRIPDPGLLVIKEVGPHDSYGTDDWLSWDALQGPPTLDPFDSAALAELEDHQRPPLAFLRYLRELQNRSRAPVTFYACETWAGDVDSEYACVLAERDILYLYPESTEQTGAIARDQAESIETDILQRTLRHHGIDLPTPFFAPHLREFAWERYRLAH
jgi:hypothetical protein